MNGAVGTFWAEARRSWRRVSGSVRAVEGYIDSFLQNSGLYFLFHRESGYMTEILGDGCDLMDSTWLTVTATAYLSRWKSHMMVVVSGWVSARYAVLVSEAYCDLVSCAEIGSTLP